MSTYGKYVFILTVLNGFRVLNEKPILMVKFCSIYAEHCQFPGAKQSRENVYDAKFHYFDEEYFSLNDFQITIKFDLYANIYFDKLIFENTLWYKLYLYSKWFLSYNKSHLLWMYPLHLKVQPHIQWTDKLCKMFRHCYESELSYVLKTTRILSIILWEFSRSNRIRSEAHFFNHTNQMQYHAHAHNVQQFLTHGWFSHAVQFSSNSITASFEQKPKLVYISFNLKLCILTCDFLRSFSFILLVSRFLSSFSAHIYHSL